MWWRTTMKTSNPDAPSRTSRTVAAGRTGMASFMVSILGSHSYDKASAPRSLPPQGRQWVSSFGASILPRIELRRSADVEFARFPFFHRPGLDFQRPRSELRTEC